MSRLADIDEDPELVARAAAGEADAQARLYRRLAGPAFALARRLVPDRAAAEDLFQDALMQAFAALPRFRGDAPLGAWVRRILVHRCLMHLRSPWQRARLAWATPAAEELALGGRREPLDERIDLERALAQLTPATRAVLWLHDVEGLTHEEIAAGMGRSASFSKSQLARGHQRLRGLLSAEEAPCPTPQTPAIR